LVLHIIFGKGIIICINKWDIIEKDNKTTSEYEKNIRNKLKFCSYAPILFISAKTGQRVSNIFKEIVEINKYRNTRISTAKLNEILGRAVATSQPPSDKGKVLKVFYITQVSICPPTFAVFVNNKELMHFSYLRFLENEIRRYVSFKGTDIVLLTREKKGKFNE